MLLISYHLLYTFLYIYFFFFFYVHACKYHISGYGRELYVPKGTIIILYLYVPQGTITVQDSDLYLYVPEGTITIRDSDLCMTQTGPL